MNYHVNELAYASFCYAMAKYILNRMENIINNIYLRDINQMMQTTRQFIVSPISSAVCQIFSGKTKFFVRFSVFLALYFHFCCCLSESQVQVFATLFEFSSSEQIIYKS